MAADNSFHGRHIKAVNEVRDLYNADRLEECVEKGYELLAQPNLPQDQKLTLLILLAGSVGDELEANNFRMDAETMWAVFRAWHPKQEDPKVDRFLAQARERLDECTAALLGDISDAESEFQDWNAMFEAHVDQEEEFDSDDETREGSVNGSDEQEDSASEAVSPESEPEVVVVVQAPTGSPEKHRNRKQLALHLKEPSATLGDKFPFLAPKSPAMASENWRARSISPEHATTQDRPSHLVALQKALAPKWRRMEEQEE
ncbi:hypothetical protein NX059_010485 [Plenodomus lindquistii]|nr:hypothetical protein NX059_010485 [Plenodomus lindquistii]